MSSSIGSSKKSSGRGSVVTYGDRWRRKWLKKLMISAAVLAVIGILTVLFGPRVYEAGKSWRARKLVETAYVLKEAGLEIEMRDRLLRAFLLSGDDPVVLRAMAKDYSTTPVETLQFLQRLSLTQHATLQDRLELCRVAVESRLTVYAKADFDRLMADPAMRDNAEAAELIARYLTLQGQASEALKWVGGSAASAPAQAVSEANEEETGSKEVRQIPAPSDSPRLNLIRAKLLLDAPQPDKAALARTAAEVKMLMTAVLEHGEDKEKREAALLLARVYVTIPAMREEIGEDMGRELLTTLEQWQDESKWQARLVAADLQIFLNDDRKAAVIDQLLELAPKADEATQQELARWLTRRGEAARAQALAESGPDREQNRDWFLIRMDAMASQKKWPEIETILLDPAGVPIEEALGRLYLWRCAKESGANAAAIKQSLEQIVASCAKSPPAVAFYAAGYLEQFGERATAARLYRKLSDNEAFAGPAFVGLVRSLASDPSQSEALRDALEKMLTRFPAAKEGKNDLAYLNLLEGRKLSESIMVAAELVTQAPQMLAYRTTMALAELVRGNAKAAESIYTGVEVDWTTVNPGWVAVRAAVLAANGKLDEAHLLADPLNPATLRDGEKRLLDKYLKQKDS